MKKTAQGYTLIELLIVMVLIGILVTIGLTTFQSYAQQQSLISVVRMIQTDLRLTQGLAVAGNKPSQCVNQANPNDPNYTLNSYSLLVTSSSSYSVEANCIVGGANSVVIIKSVSIPAGITITNPFPNPVVFKTLSQGTNIQAASSAIIFIRQASTGNIKSITIGSNGDVK